MEQLRQVLENMGPREALELLLPHLKNIMANLDEEARIRLVSEMVGGPGADKISSMVDL
ncbi:MAG: hypothetical protein P8130_09625 [Deltaproteobacteria bacterium]